MLLGEPLEERLTATWLLYVQAATAALAASGAGCDASGVHVPAAPAKNGRNAGDEGP